jgi:hypothetical protein
MANQNLSQFTEKTFVADADWTFVWDTAGLISKKVSRNNWLNSGTLAGASAPITVSQTWNDAAVAFTALKVNAVSTASATGSLLLDLQVGGVSQVSVSKGGQLFIKAGSPTAEGGIQYGNEFILRSVITNDSVGLLSGGTVRASMGASGFKTVSGGIFGFSDSAGSSVNSDTILLRDGAANTLALRNGAAAQTFNVYGTYTSGSAYARLAIACDTSGNATLTTQSTGTAGTVSINGVPVGLGKGGSAFNVAVGTNALAANTTGAYIVAVGNGALQSNTTGNSNTAVGLSALFVNTTGGFNSAFGLASLNQNSSGGFNTALGAYALESNSTGGNNVGIGYYSLRRNTTGSNNLAIGYLAGYYITGGATDNALANNSLFLGANTKANASGESNQIVIGYDATGLGSNSVVLGNSTIDKTALRGNVGIGTTAPSSKLQVTGGDVEIETVTSGIIMKAAGTSTRYRITLNAGGTALVFTAI